MTKTLVFVLVIIALTATVTLQAVGNHSSAAPVSLATVNIVRVLDGLNERLDAESELRAFVDGIQQEDTRRLEQIRALEQQLETTAAGSPERRALQEEIERQLFNLQYWRQLQDEKHDVEISLMLQDLYRSIKAAIAEYAQVEGYDVVFVNDSSGEIRFNADVGITREAQVRQQISGRQLLYVGDAVDVTDDLIQRMNNRHDAGG